MRSMRADPTQPSPGKTKGIGPSSAFGKDDLGLSFYANAPDVEMSIREFEEFVCNRLKVLHAFDRLCGYETSLAGISELRPKLIAELRSTNLILDYPSGSTADTFLEHKTEFMRRDSVSHFALRLAFCNTRDGREWLLKQEQRFFVFRYEALNPEAKDTFLEKSGVKVKKFEPSQKMTLQKLQSCTSGSKIWSENRPVYDTTFYELPFTDVPSNLIATRKIVVSGGMAYIPSSALKLILASRFKDRLNEGLDVAFNGLPAALADPRVGGFLRMLQDHGMQMLVAPKVAVSEDAGEKLSLENFEELMVRSFPPCMRRIIEHQRESKKHLKHAGRLQLRPFLKECGFTIDESFKWWRQELCRDPTIDGTAYDKNYTYDVEHAYGRKGHLQGQNPFGCPKIINFPNEAAGQVHGCMFKQLEIPMIKQQLHRWQVPEATANEVQKLIENGKHFQLACMEYFKAIHPGNEGDGVGNSPMDFYRLSCQHYKQNKEKDAAATPQKSKDSLASPTKV